MAASAVPPEEHRSGMSRRKRLKADRLPWSDGIDPIDINAALQRVARRIRTKSLAAPPCGARLLVDTPGWLVTKYEGIKVKGDKMLLTGAEILIECLLEQQVDTLDILGQC